MDGDGNETVGDSSSWSIAPPRDLTGKLLGDFQVERMLGHGGMGEVYLARQVSLDRPVALKVLRREWASNPTYMARFESEAWAAAKLNHPNIVHIYSLGGLDDLRFIAMEYVQGTNLKEYIQKKGVPDLPLALAVMRQSGLAVGAAGEAGLIHRDIKPENLLMTRKGQIKVADFGLAQLPEGNRLHLTAPGMSLGTPMYMSPEQVQGMEVDHRSDLYSLGVTFYHMLAGVPPFHAETAVALALKHVREKPANLASHRPDLPKPLVALVMKLMAKSPADRYSSAGEMLKDLTRIKESLQIGVTGTAPTVGDGIGTPSTVAMTEAYSEETGPASWRPSGWSITLTAMAAMILGAALGWTQRSVDVLSVSAPSEALVPGVWMANWSAIPKQPTAEAQYRFAQMRSTPQEREAAWLAVPGRFPQDADRSLSSYVQLARLYLRRGDADRLGILSREIKESENNRDSARQSWMNLAGVAHAAQSAVEGDVKKVVARFQALNNLAVMDPALAELSLEVVDRAILSAGEPSPALINFRNQLLGPLRLPAALMESSPALQASD
jgi:eukaryotic-like serine/threonine-protein kinase